MEKILIFIKHHFGFFWKLIEITNNSIFTLLYKKSLEKTVPVIMQKHADTPYTYKEIDINDAEALFQLIANQPSNDLKYFSPHGFSLAAIKDQFKKKSFLMMGVYDDKLMVGYFFLRFFANKKCFVGRLIDTDYRGKKIGLKMNEIMYQIAWKMNFRCLSTISRNNKAVIKAHGKNSSMVVLKELQNDYLLVEFKEVEN